MLPLNRENFPCLTYPSRVLQFGSGNFLRAFVDWQIDILNEHTDFNSGITIVRSMVNNSATTLNAQQGLYTCLIRGLDQNGDAVSTKRMISSVNGELAANTEFEQVLALAVQPALRFVFSNTTEAGITFNPEDVLDANPPQSFPAKLTRVLWARYQYFSGDAAKGLVIIPCELIDYNGVALKNIIEQYISLWALPEEFKHWVDTANTFCSTLVDRIVTGYPEDEASSLTAEFNYQDNFIVCAESYYLFVIQGPDWLQDELCLKQLPADQQLNIKIVDDIKPYKERKVAILNGAHTALVPVAYQAGLDTVGDSMLDEQLAAYLKTVMFNEIIPTLSLPKGELISFAQDVEQRFKNPYIRHLLLAIALNGMSKFKTRILPQIINYVERHGTPPPYLTFALAALMTFYRGVRGSEPYKLADEPALLEFFQIGWQNIEAGTSSIDALVNALLANANHWGTDLTKIKGLSAMVCDFVNDIIQLGMRAALTKCQQEVL